MKNDKGYEAIVRLSYFTISGEYEKAQRIAPVHLDLKNPRRVLSQIDDREEYLKIMSQYKTILDSLDSNNPLVNIDMLCTSKFTNHEIKVDNIFYEGSADTIDERLRFEHKMPYEEYIERGKPSAIGIIRVAKDDITSTFD